MEFIITAVVLIGFAMLMRPMAILSANIERARYVDQELRVYPVAADVVIYKGALVGLHPATGLLKPYEPPDVFIGVAYEACSNSGGAASAVSCTVQTIGDFELPLAGITDAHSGLPVFATADDALSLAGHPDAFVGRIVNKAIANVAVVRLRRLGERIGAGESGALEYVYRGGPVAPTGAVAGNAPVGDFQAFSILGLGATYDQAVGGVSLAFDAVAEVAQGSIETPLVLQVNKGMSLEVDINAESIGDDAALDIDVGFVNVLDATTRANLDDATATRIVTFHIDGASANINLQSDDNVTDVAPVDTGVDNATAQGATKRLHLIVRPNGKCEGYIDGARVNEETVFSVGAAAGVFAAFINMEKTNNDTTGEVVAKFIRAAGARG
ncbi:MAG: hypothetical protein H6819_06730 [Phycisphaerales bacterium]|nr:hypothetical protein [Phycisphaerales bacterium]MCB9855276.1 hypothetical protein [Phycisphaerales bacterium]MCB9862869.1 hypothetical protein [Phycisphaerales bacterium]